MVYVPQHVGQASTTENCCAFCRILECSAKHSYGVKKNPFHYLSLKSNFILHFKTKHFYTVVIYIKFSDNTIMR